MSALTVGGAKELWREHGRALAPDYANLIDLLDVVTADGSPIRDAPVDPNQTYNPKTTPETLDAAIKRYSAEGEHCVDPEYREGIKRVLSYISTGWFSPAYPSILACANRNLPKFSKIRAEELQNIYYLAEVALRTGRRIGKGNPHTRVITSPTFDSFTEVFHERLLGLGIYGPLQIISYGDQLHAVTDKIADLHSKANAQVRVNSSGWWTAQETPTAQIIMPDRVFMLGFTPWNGFREGFEGVLSLNEANVKRQRRKFDNLWKELSE
jgi:hypothetical protein